MSTPPATPDEARALILTPDVLRLLAVLGDATRVVGGAVRNAFMGYKIEDYDLATALSPREAMAHALAEGWKVVPTGIDHGTITVVIAGRPYEVTTLREDIATNGRHAEVRFGTSFRQDAARRDFTINAMSMGADGVLHDDFGGMADLAARKVRFIGAPEQRLREDYLRGLRFLRFSATYAAGPLDPAGLAGVLANRAGFAQLSRERVRQEFLKLVMAPRALEVLGEAEEAGLISEILGLRVDIARLKARLEFGAANAMERLFALCIFGEAQVISLRESLRLSNAEMKALSQMAQGVNLFGHANAADMRAMAADFPEVARALVLQIGVLRGTDFAREGLKAMEPMPRFLLTGKDAMALGVATGPPLGEVLAKARWIWVHRGCDNHHDAQLACLLAAIEDD